MVTFTHHRTRITLANAGRFLCMHRCIINAQAPPRCIKCNSPHINGQCTITQWIRTITVLLYGPLLCGFNVLIKGLNISISAISAWYREHARRPPPSAQNSGDAMHWAKLTINPLGTGVPNRNRSPIITNTRRLQASSENASFCHVITLIFPNCAHRILLFFWLWKVFLK